jgi:hypothetical protein
MLSVLAELQRELSVSNTNKDAPQPTPADAPEAAARRGDGQCPWPLKEPRADDLGSCADLAQTRSSSFRSGLIGLRAPGPSACSARRTVQSIDGNLHVAWGHVAAVEGEPESLGEGDAGGVGRLDDGNEVVLGQVSLRPLQLCLRGFPR